MCECATWYDAILENFPAQQQRFAIEYKELADRAEKLSGMLDKYDAGQLGFQLQTPIGLLRAQLSIMCAYMAILEERAEFEGIDLSILADHEE